MPWSAGVYTRTNGVFSGPTVWQQDAAVPVDILADRHDTHDQDIATGLNNCVTIDGLNKPAASIVPGTDATYNLGSAAARWANIYLSSSAYLYNGSTNAVQLIAGTLTVARTATFPDATGNVVLDSATQTLTNKTLGPLTLSGAVIASGLLSGTVAANSFIGLNSGNTLVLSAASGGGGGVTNVGFAAASADVVITGTNPNVGTGTTTIGLGTVSVAKGGTGAATLTAHGLLVGEGTSPVQALAAMTNGQIAIGSTGNNPVPGTITAGTNITVTNNAGGITISASTGSGLHNSTILTTSGSVVAGAGVDYMIVNLQAPGGSGSGTSGGIQGTGGGAGAYIQVLCTVTGGATLTFTNGSGGASAGAGNNNGNPGGNVTLSSSAGGSITLGGGQGGVRNSTTPAAGGTLVSASPVSGSLIFMTSLGSLAGLASPGSAASAGASSNFAPGGAGGSSSDGSAGTKGSGGGAAGAAGTHAGGAGGDGCAEFVW